MLLYYGKEASTNNLAEIKALEDLMRWLINTQDDLGIDKHLVILGDS